MASVKLFNLDGTKVNNDVKSVSEIGCRIPQYTKEEIVKSLLKDNNNVYLKNSDELVHCRRCDGVRMSNIKVELRNGEKYDGWLPVACECMVNKNWKPKRVTQIRKPYKDDDDELF